MGESRKYLLAKNYVEKSCKIKLAPQNAGQLFCKYFLEKKDKKLQFGHKCNFKCLFKYILAC